MKANESITIMLQSNNITTILITCLLGPSSADRQSWWQYEQQQPSMTYVQGLCRSLQRRGLLHEAICFMSVEGSRFGGGQAVQLSASYDDGMRLRCVALRLIPSRA